MTDDNNQTIVFGGGCFWCTEAVFKLIKGVISVEPGYAGGSKINPTYDEVSTGQTGHAEAIRIVYNPEVVMIRDLLIVFFGSHDPTTLNRQGNDIGTQYRSAVFYTNKEQLKETEKIINEINTSSPSGSNVVTEVKLLNKFYLAENYHKDYFANHPGNPYCELVINPKLEKIQKEFANLLNKNN